MKKLQKIVLLCLCFLVAFILVACDKTSVKITQTDEATTVYVGDEVNPSKYFKIEVNEEEIPVTMDMIEGTVDTTKPGNYTIKCSYVYKEKTYDLSINIEVIAKEVVDKVEITQTTQSTTLEYGSDVPPLTNYFQIKINDAVVPTTLDMITGTVDTNVVGDHVITCTFEYQGQTYKLDVKITVLAPVVLDTVEVGGTDISFYVEENITSTTLLQLLKEAFFIKVNDTNVTIEDNMIDSSKVLSTTPGVYQATLTYVHQDVTYKKTIQVVVVDGLTALRTALVQPYTNYSLKIEHNGENTISFYRNLVKTIEDDETVYYGYDRIDDDYYKLVPYKDNYRRTNIDNGDLYNYYTSIIALDANDFEFVSEGNYKVKESSLVSVLNKLLNVDGSEYTNISITLSMDQIVNEITVSYEENGAKQTFVISVINYNKSNFEVNVVDIDFNDFLPTLDDETNRRGNTSIEGLDNAFAHSYDNMKITGSIDLINKYDHDYTELEYIKTPTVCKTTYNGFSYIRTWDAQANAYLTVPMENGSEDYDFYSEDELERYLLSLELSTLLQLNSNYFEVGEDGYFIPIEGYELAILYVVFGHFFYYTTGIDFGQIPEANISCEGIKLKVYNDCFYHIAGRFKYVDETGEELYATMKFEIRDIDKCELEMPDTSYVTSIDRAFAFLGYTNRFGLTYRSEKQNKSYKLNMNVQNGLIEYQYKEHPAYLASQYIQYNNQLYLVYIRQYVNDFGYWDEEIEVRDVFNLGVPNIQMSFKFRDENNNLIRYSNAFTYNQTAKLYECKKEYISYVANSLIGGYIVTGDRQAERFGSYTSILLSLNENRVEYIEFTGKDVDGVNDLTVRLEFKPLTEFTMPSLYSHWNYEVPGLDAQSDTEGSQSLEDLDKAFQAPMDNVAVDCYEAYSTFINDIDEGTETDYERNRYYYEVCQDEIYSYNPATGEEVISCYVPSMNLYYILNFRWIDIGFHAIMTPSRAQQYRYSVNTDFSKYKSENFEAKDGYFVPKAGYMETFATSFFGELGYYDFYVVTVEDVKLKVVNQRVEYVGVRFNQVFSMGGTTITNKWQVEYFFSDYGQIEHYGLNAIVDPLDLALFEKTKDGFYSMNYQITKGDQTESIMIYNDDYLSSEESVYYRKYVMPDGKIYYLTPNGFMGEVNGAYKYMQESFVSIPLPYHNLFNHEVVSNMDVFFSMFFEYDEKTGCYECLPDWKSTVFAFFFGGYLVFNGQCIEITTDDEDLFTRFAFRLDEAGHIAEVIVQFDDYDLTISFGKGEVFTVPTDGSLVDGTERPPLDDMNKEEGTVEQEALEKAIEDLFNNYSYTLQCYADSPIGEELYTVSYTIDGNIARVDLMEGENVTTYYIEYLGKDEKNIDMFNVYVEDENGIWIKENGSLEELMDAMIIDYFDIKSLKINMLEPGNDGYFVVKKEYRSQLFCEMFGYDPMEGLLTYDVTTFKIKVVNNKIVSVIVAVEIKSSPVYGISYYVSYSVLLNNYNENDLTLPNVTEE